MNRLASIALVASLLGAVLPVRAHDIVLLGDESRAALLVACKACAGQKLSIGTPGPRASAQEVASAAQHARHAVIVVDAAMGPLPITREHVLIARQAGVPSLSVMFSNLGPLEGMADAGELLELEALETRELMNLYQMGGDKALLFHAQALRAAKAPRASGIGMPEMLRTLQNLPERKPVAGEAFTGKRFAAHLYLLTLAESKYVAPLANGASIGLWINGQSLPARVRAGSTLQPGTNADLELEAGTPVTASIGARFLLERGGHIVAAGVLVQGR